MCPCDTWTMENVSHGKMNSRVRGSFLSLEGNQKNSVGKVRKKGNKKKKRKENEEKEKKKKEKEKEKDREKKKKNKKRESAGE